MIFHLTPTALLKQTIFLKKEIDVSKFRIRVGANVVGVGDHNCVAMVGRLNTD